ncbi:AraC-like DNA-binding protein [Mucilaginibacter lappiensis]|uniref:AraC-like DNA-binding protein n=1 Tax=Mucilaginibacter lappiensis TaxID=354630 RepID=A0ABR6PFU0_9SPHI|nr:AraC family transcriptional regulator [Mucilaginibacter lappiensis]MBB6108638.1 AraC-like DNA-binding protein [Mucilaginibacter lappiensis]
MQTNNDEKFVKRPSERDKLYSIKEYLEKNYANPINLHDICTMFGINDFKLKNGFREIFQTSVIGFVINKRLEASLTLLAERNLNISEIAYQTGYSSPQHFSKSFKRKYGISPSQIN